MERPITVHCPFCGERFTTFVDPSLLTQSYIEDCQVCCRPIEMHFEVDDEGEIDYRGERS